LSDDPWLRFHQAAQAAKAVLCDRV
jgi:hypothetical protein